MNSSEHKLNTILVDILVDTHLTQIAPGQAESAIERIQFDSVGKKPADNLDGCPLNNRIPAGESVMDFFFVFLLDTHLNQIATGQTSSGLERIQLGSSDTKPAGILNGCPLNGVRRGVFGGT